MVKSTINNCIFKIALLYLDAVQQAYPGSKCLIFGSQVKGNSTQSSDVDIADISEKFTNKHKNRVDLMNLCNATTAGVEPHPTNPLDFNNKFDAFIAKVQKYGIEY